jgi:Tol biopolymer transport system component
VTGPTGPYSVDLDGSHLTPLLAPGRDVEPVGLSRDGTVIVYSASKEDLPAAIYTSHADGTAFRRVARKGSGPVLSPSGRFLAFTTPRGVWIVGTDGKGLRRLTSGHDDACAWSPDGRAVVFMRAIKSDRFAVVVKPLRGKQRVLVRTGPNEDASTDEYQPAWSPNGRWIAYVNHEDRARLNGLTLVRPNGKLRHRVVLGAGDDDAFQWSPDGHWLAYLSAPDLYAVQPSGDWFEVASHFAGYSIEWSPDRKHLAFPVFTDNGEDIAVARGDGHGAKRLHLAAAVYPFPAPLWSPDSRSLAFGGRTGHDPLQIWAVGSDGRGLHRLTNEGENYPLGWTRLVPTLPSANPLPVTERVTDMDSVATDTPIAALSADGARVAFAPRSTATDCVHVVLWTPGETALRRLGNLPSPCRDPSVDAPPVTRIALADSRAAWVEGVGKYSDDGCFFSIMSATLVDPAAREIGGTGGEPAFGQFCNSGDPGHLQGDGDLLVFNDEPTHPSWLVRIGAGSEKCRDLFCTTLRKDARGAPVASVSQGLIAVRKAGAVAILDAHGALVRVFSFTPADVNAALLDGGRLVVWRFGVLELYDVTTGALVLSRPLPPGLRLTDVDGGIAVLRNENAITVLRLGDGSSFTLTPGGTSPLADLEPSGLFYSFATGGGGRLVFVPRSTVLSRLQGVG